MRVLVACARGSAPIRDKHGRCICGPCKDFNRARQRSMDRSAYKRAWVRSNPEKQAAYAKKWLAANPETRRQIEYAWRVRHPEKVAEMSARAGAKWTAANRGKRNAITAARRAALRLRLPKWADRDAIKAFYEEAARLTAETGIPHEVDHIVPLQGETVSGLHVPINLRVIPRSLNRSKRNAWGGVPSAS